MCESLTFCKVDIKLSLLSQPISSEPS